MLLKCAYRGRNLFLAVLAVVTVFVLCGPVHAAEKAAPKKAAPKTTTDSRAIKRLESRIADLEEQNRQLKSAFQNSASHELDIRTRVMEKDIEALEDRIDSYEKLTKEIDDKSQKRIEDAKWYYSRLLLFYTGGFAALLAVLGFLGIKTVSKWIQISIEDNVQERIGEIKALTEEAVHEIIEKVSEPIIKEKLLKIETLHDDYREKLENLESQKNLKDISKPFSEEVKKQLEDFKKGLEAAKAEANYTAKDWFYLGLEEGDKGNHAKAADFYIRSADMEPNVSNLSNAALALYKNRDYEDAEKYFERAYVADPKEVNNLCNYANFLWNVRQEYDRAEEYFKQAIEADSDHVNSLGAYAVLLQNIRKDYTGAEEYYKRAIDINPNHSNNLGNYVGFLLGQGRIKEGFDFLNKAIDAAKKEIREDLLLECYFYKYAHVQDESERKQALAEVRKLITAGVRSLGWDLSQNVERAIADGHPEPELLKVLAKVIADEKKAEALEQFKVWQEA